MSTALRLERTLPAPAWIAFEKLTNPGLDYWWPPPKYWWTKTDVEVMENGRLRIEHRRETDVEVMENGRLRIEHRREDDAEPIVWSGEIHEVVPEEKLSYSLQCHIPASVKDGLESWAPPDDAGPWTLTLTLTADGEQTRLAAECEGCDIADREQVEAELQSLVDRLAYACWYDVTESSMRTQHAIAQIQGDFRPEHLPTDPDRPLTETDLMKFIEMLSPFSIDFFDTNRFQPLMLALIDDDDRPGETIATVFHALLRGNNTHPTVVRALADNLFSLIDRDSPEEVQEAVSEVLAKIRCDVLSGRIDLEEAESKGSWLMIEMFNDTKDQSASRIDPRRDDQVGALAAAVDDVFGAPPFNAVNGMAASLMMTLMAFADCQTPEVARVLFRHWLRHVDAAELQRVLDYHIKDRTGVDIRVALDEAEKCVRSRTGLSLFPVAQLRRRYFGEILKRNTADKLKRLFGGSRK